MSNQDIKLEPGVVVRARGRDFRVVQLLHLNEFVATDVEEGTRAILSTGELDLVFDDGDTHGFLRPDILSLGEEAWKAAVDRFDLLKPLLAKPDRTAADVREFATKHGQSVATIYRQLSNSAALGSPIALMRRPRADIGPLDFEALPEGQKPTSLEQMVVTLAREKLEREERASDVSFCRDVIKKVTALEWDVPHENTVRRVMARLPPSVLVSIRKGRKAGLQLAAMPGEFPDAFAPYQLFQIDHTKLDVIIVAEGTRRPIGRAWGTIVIEVHSRAIPGFGISIDAPSTASISAAIRQSVLRKDRWLEERGLSVRWPIHGKPIAIHADNAREFRGDTLKRVCKSYNMDLYWRPVKKPRYGAHIERLMGTLATVLKDVRGTTYSNPIQRAEYDSAGNAYMTLDELERWMVHRLAVIYNLTPHSGINKQKPLTRLTEGIIGTADKPGAGSPPMVRDERRFYLDFLPRVERVISPKGVLIAGIHYYDDKIRHLIGEKQEDNLKRSKAQSFAIDDREISPIYFFDKMLHDYIPLPYANPSRTPISAWERDAARKHAQEKNRNPDDEDAIFRSVEELKIIENEATQLTLTAQRSQEAKRHRDKTLAADRKTLEAETPKSKPPAPPINDPIILPRNRADDDDDVGLFEVEYE